jgi:hypothetical protein
VQLSIIILDGQRVLGTCWGIAERLEIQIHFGVRARSRQPDMYIIPGSTRGAQTSRIISTVLP